MASDGSSAAFDGGSHGVMRSRTTWRSSPSASRCAARDLTGAEAEALAERHPSSPSDAVRTTAPARRVRAALGAPCPSRSVAPLRAQLNRIQLVSPATAGSSCPCQHGRGGRNPMRGLHAGRGSEQARGRRIPCPPVGPACARQWIQRTHSSRRSSVARSPRQRLTRGGFTARTPRCSNSPSSSQSARRRWIRRPKPRPPGSPRSRSTPSGGWPASSPPTTPTAPTAPTTTPSFRGRLHEGLQLHR